MAKVIAANVVVIGLTGRGASGVGRGGPGEASGIAVDVSWGDDGLRVKGLPPLEVAKSKGLFADDGGGEGSGGGVLSDRVGVGEGLVTKEVC